MEYKFKYRRKWFWRSIKIAGHSYQENQDKMVLYKKDGSIEEIHHWKDCSAKLGTDWVLFTKTQMEKQSGQQININQEG